MADADAPEISGATPQAEQTSEPFKPTLILPDEKARKASIFQDEARRKASVAALTQNVTGESVTDLPCRRAR